MGLRPWMNSSDLIESVKRKIAVPLNQRTFSEEDILAFANEELMIAQVPDIMMYHEEYFVYSEDVLLTVNRVRYPIPERAMGQKLRDIYYVDNNGNLFEMTRINPDDKAYWQRENASINIMQKYYLEGNEIVLAPQNISSPTGYLRFSYFLRPNQLVNIDRAATIASFFNKLTVTDASLSPGDTLSVGDLVFTAVSGSPSALEFQIGGSNNLTAANLADAINLDGTYSATVATNVVSLIFTNLKDIYFYSSNIFNPLIQTKLISSNPSGITVGTQIGFNTTGTISSNITLTTPIDILQTKPGHRLYLKDVNLLSRSTNAITFDQSILSLNIEVGDYFCEQYECIIPQIPPDLHNGLAERTSARILAAQGDMQGLQISEAKINDIKKAEGILTENRVDGSSQKVNQRKSPLSFLRMGIRRRI